MVDNTYAPKGVVMRLINACRSLKFFLPGEISAVFQIVVVHLTGSVADLTFPPE